MTRMMKACRLPVVLMFLVFLVGVVHNVDSFVSPSPICRPSTSRIQQKVSEFRTQARKQNFSVIRNSQRPPKRRGGAGTNFLIVAGATIGALWKFGATDNAVRVVSTTVVSTWAFLKLLRRLSRPRSSDVNNDLEIDEPPSVEEMAWVNRRLSEAREVARKVEEKRLAEMAENEARRQKMAQKWAKNTLKTTTNAFERAEDEKRRMAAEKRKEELWLESTAKGSGIKLNLKSDQSTRGGEPIDADERRMLEYRNGKGDQLWVENAVRGSRASFRGYSSPPSNSTDGTSNFDEESGDDFISQRS